MASISQLLTGYPGQITPLPIYSPEQQKAFGGLLEQGQQAFNPMDLERYSQQQFQQNMVPSLSEQFTSLGSGGSPSSPVFQNRLANAAAQQSTALAALRSNQGLKALQLGLTPQFEYMYQPERPGLLEAGATSAAQALAGQAPGLIGKLGSYLFGGSSQPGQQQAPGAAATLGQMAQTAAPSLAQNALASTLPSAGAQAAQSALPAATGSATTALQAAPAVAGAGLAAGAQPAATGLGTAATAAAGAAMLPAALALGVPAAIGLLGFGAIKAYDSYKYYQNKKKRELHDIANAHLKPNNLPPGYGYKGRKYGFEEKRKK